VAGLQYLRGERAFSDTEFAGIVRQLLTRLPTSSGVRQEFLSTLALMVTPHWRLNCAAAGDLSSSAQRDPRDAPSNDVNIDVFEAS